MRISYPYEGRFDCPSVLEVILNLQCRDEIIPILKALQHLYGQSDVRDKILALVEQDINGTSSPSRGRPGMTYWEILVLASVRLGCNLDYDKLQDLAENHTNLRHIMGIGDWSPKGQFDWRRIWDNVHRLHPETVTQINHLIVSEGHQLNPSAPKTVRADSFVVQTNIHYPTDSSLIGDGLRKILEIAPKLAAILPATGWRQSKHLQKKCKRILRRINRTAKSKGRNYASRLQQAYQVLFDLADSVLERSIELERTVKLVFPNERIIPLGVKSLCDELAGFIEKTERVCDVAKRRIVDGEQVPNEDKLFSLFEPHTELINRGKRPVSTEFGHRVFIVEDGAGLICHYKVMAIGEQDPDVLIPEMEAVQKRLNGQVERASFDRGFHSPDNQAKLKSLFTHPCLAARGKHQESQQAKEATVAFREARQKHPGVESAIGALQFGNGLRRCRDRTVVGYARYIALGILGRNLHVLGKLLIAETNPKSIAGKSRRGLAA